MRLTKRSTQTPLEQPLPAWRLVRGQPVPGSFAERLSRSHTRGRQQRRIGFAKTRAALLSIAVRGVSLSRSPCAR